MSVIIHKIFKRVLIFVVETLMLFSLFACNVKENKKIISLDRTDWSSDVKTAVNDFLNEYSKERTKKQNYVVFDFDNTSSIFDIQHQLAIYQLQNMAFAFTPNEIKDILASDLSNKDVDLTEYGYGKGSYNDWIDDIYNAYTKLYESYGPFTAIGVDDKTKETIQNDDNWKEFATKMRALYALVSDHETGGVSCAWLLYWFTGMTEEETFNLARRSHELYRQVETSLVTWESPKDIISKVGPISYTWTSGVQVTENIKELYKKINEAGIDVWICSASSIEAVRAAVDVFGLKDYVTGILGMTIKVADGKFVSEYDYENGTYYLCKGGKYRKGDKVTLTMTQGDGKVISINNTCAKIYGTGPIAGFMDSTGDFNFCTMYDTLKLVVCFNRASRKVTDGGGLISEIAIYQKDTLKENLKSANDKGDTLYVLQGRDENSYRTFRSSNKSMVFGAKDEKLFANENNEKQLDYIIKNKLCVKDAIDKFAIKTDVDDINNNLGFKYGFLTKYDGYHSIK